MTEDKNLTPFSIADILKTDDRAGDGDAAATVLHRANNCADRALDMTNNKCAHKKGKSTLLLAICTLLKRLIFKSLY